MNCVHRTTFVILLAITLCSSSNAFQEQQIRKKDVPGSVISSFQKAYPHARAKGFSKETEAGKTIYEIESIEGTIKRDVSVDTEGNIVSIEEEIDRRDLPAAVKTALQKEYL